MTEQDDILVIRRQLDTIFLNRVHFDFPKLEQKDATILDATLLGPKLRLMPRDLLYLFFDVEKVFGITITQEDIQKNGFRTYRKILDCVLRARLKSHV